VYGKNDKDALGEDDDRVLGSARLSRWFYASAKAIDEAFAWPTGRRPAYRYVVRLFNTVGARSQVATAWSCRASCAGRCATSHYGSTRWQQTRCFTNVHDVVHALTVLMQTPTAAGEIFNIGQPNEIRIVDLARRVIELAESASELKLVPMTRGSARRARGGLRRHAPPRTRRVQAVRLHRLQAADLLDQTLREVIDYEMSDVRSQTSDGMSRWVANKRCMA